MHISKFEIQNFKSFRQAVFHFDPKVNVLTGVNNCGKTNVLEALSLWVECFQFLLRKADHTQAKTGIKKNQFTLESRSRSYRDFMDAVTARAPSYQDLFFYRDTSDPIQLIATLCSDSETLPVGFQIATRDGVSISFTLINEAQFDYQRLNHLITAQQKPVAATFVSPVSEIPNVEHYQMPLQVAHQVQRRQSIDVIRNRIDQLKKDPARFQTFTTALQSILGIDYPLQLQTLTDASTSLEIKVGHTFTSHDKPLDLALLGSGVLQMIETLLSLYSEPADLSMLLLDEPDSHIHRDIQKRLFEALTSYQHNAQLFLTTHNTNLIRSTPLHQLFSMEPKSEQVCNPLADERYVGRKSGLQASPVNRVLRDLDAGNLELLDAIEADRLILVEGEDDAIRLRKLIKQMPLPLQFPSYVFWSIGGIDRFLTHIGGYQEVFSHIGNGSPLWKKVSIVLDKDFLTDAQRHQLMEVIQHKYGRPIHIWSAYTFESTLLLDLGKLSRALFEWMKRFHPNHTAQPDPLLTTLRQATTALAQEKIAALNDTNNTEEKRVNSILENLKTKFARPAFEKRVRFETNQLIKWKDEAKPLLESGEVYHYATKEDVGALLHKVCAQFNADFDPEYSIDDLLDCFHANIHIPEWIALVRMINGN